MNLLRANLFGTTVPTLWILVLMVSVGPFGDTEYTPSLPRIAGELGVSYGAAQQSMTVYLFGYALVQLVYGPLSDRFGRKPLMLAGALLFVCGSLVCFVSYSLEALLLGRFVQGVGACAGAVLTSAAVRDSFPPAHIEQVYSRINAAFALAPAIGPVVGAFVDDHFGWHANMLVLLVMSALLLVCVLLFLPETHTADRRRSLRLRRIALGYRSLFTHRLFLPFIVINGLVIGVVYACLTEAPALVINVLGLKPRWFAVVAGGIFVAFVSGSILSNYLERHMPARKIVVLGLFVMLAGSVILGMLGLSGVSDLASTLGPIMLVFLGIALVVPNAVGAAMRPFSRLAGSASAMIGFTQMGIASAANAGVSLIPLGPLYAMPLMFGLLALLGLAVYRLGIRGREDHRRRTAALGG
ncbi:MAG: multidrug effflux MFS transporter [Gammaproteobacteria bacterium]